MMGKWVWLAAGAVLAGWPAVAVAEPASGINSGDTAWMLTSMALVLFMTIPGLALFYGGLVRTKNVLSVLMQCLAITSLVTVMWAVAGYSLAFSPTGMTAGHLSLHSFVGALDKVFCRGLTADSVYGTQTIPEPLFFCYQLTFAIITPALIIGAFAERMKFSAMLWFMGLWTTFVYFPVAHMVWGGAGSFLGRPQRAGFCGRDRGASQRGDRGAGLRAGVGKTSGVSDRGHAAAQPGVHRSGYGDAVGGVVWVQRG